MFLLTMVDLVAGRASSSSPPLQWVAVTLAHSGFGQKKEAAGEEESRTRVCRAEKKTAK
jgi:hypothetical protein